MFNTTYEVNGTTGKIAVRKDMIFGWCIIINDTPSGSLKYGHEFSAQQLAIIGDLFVGPLYPEDLKEAFEDAIAEATDDEERWAQRELVYQQEMAARFQAAEAMAVAPADEALNELRKQLAEQAWKHRQALSRLAIEFVNRCLSIQLAGSRGEERFRRIRAFLMDNVFELSLRSMGSGGRYLSQDDCQVTVNRPSDPELVALLDGIIPFTE